MSALVSPHRSLFGTIPDGQREDLLQDYLAFLARRDGALDAHGRFAHREAWLAEASRTAAAHPRPMAQATFEAQYAARRPDATLPPEHVALMAFVKMNAGEAYGVEAVGRAREKVWRERPDAFSRVEQLLGNEERYHTRILVGAAEHFGVKAEGAWRPPLMLRLLIGGLVHVPRGMFHPVLLASELAGVFQFNWTLRRVGELFRDQPAVRDAMEARLVEILIDELGHVAFNRLAVGQGGLATARRLAALVARGTVEMTPEVAALGLTPRVVAEEFPRFDLGALPAEVRQRAFFC